MISSLILTFITGIFIVLGGILILLFKDQRKIHSFSIGLSIGVLVFLIVSHMIPESYELLSSEFGKFGSIIILLLVILLGILFIKLLDHFLPGHDSNVPSTHVAKMTSVALSIHNIVEGMATFMTCMIDLKTGFFLVIGVSMHNLVLGLSVGSEYYAHSRNKKGLLLMLIFLGLSTLLGGVIMAIFDIYLESNYILGIILSLTVGMIVYIVFFELIPHFFELRKKNTAVIGLFLGIILMFITTIIE